MKKTISINISGIIFYIEEDGYDKLNNYLNAIQQYFSNYEGNKEIVADIESRVAEIFLAKDKQVITLEDVEILIATMGTVADFEAAEAEERNQTQQQNNINNTGKSQDQESYAAPSRKLYRDERRKTLGGVASGLAYHLKIDPIWIRLVFLLGTMAYGSFLLLYIIMWIVIPGSNNLEEDASVKKFFRNPDDKLVSGVISGIGAYFGSDKNTVTIIRILWAISFFFFGLGLATYIILLIITPEAKTVTEKMQMQGQPVTLANIETNIRKNLNEPESGEESIIAKILLFPFRVIAQVFKALSPLAAYVVGLFLIFIAASIILSASVALGALVGVIQGDFVHFGNIPTDFLRGHLPYSILIFGFLVVIIPVIFIGLLGTVIISRKSIINKPVALSLIGIWVISIVGVSISGTRFASSFRRNDYVEKVQLIEINAKNIHLNLREEGEEDYENTRLYLEGYSGTQVKLIQKFESQGRNREDARLNAQMITYNYVVQDSVITFDSNFKFKDNAIFRAQELNMTLQIPYGTIFTIDDRMWQILRNFEGEIKGNQFQFTKKDGLVCLTCKEESTDGNEETNDGQSANQDSYFNEVTVAGVFDVHIKKGSTCSYRIDNESKYKGDLKTEIEGNELKITYSDENFFNLFKSRNERIRIEITMPELRKLALAGATNANVSGLAYQDDLEVALAGACTADMDIKANRLDVDLVGASTLKIRGNAEQLDLDVVGASKVDGFELKANDVKANVTGASQANLFVVRDLKADVSGASSLRYKGNPDHIQKEVSGGSSIEGD